MQISYYARKIEEKVSYFILRLGESRYGLRNFFWAHVHLIADGIMLRRSQQLLLSFEIGDFSHRNDLERSTSQFRASHPHQRNIIHGTGMLVVQGRFDEKNRLSRSSGGVVGTTAA